MCLSCVLSIIPNTITNHYEIEKLTLRRSKIVEITDSFNIAEVEYHKLISLFLKLIAIPMRSQTYFLSIIHFQLNTLLINLQRERAN